MIKDRNSALSSLQRKLSSDLKPQYDFMGCGAGPSGSVVAGRLAENSDVSVLLVEAGGWDVSSLNSWTQPA
jgi:choline dehydrogenase